MKGEEMNFITKLTFVDGIMATLMFLAGLLTAGFYLWEMHWSPYAREQKRKKKEKET
tara:strand:+ start:125 stop:295 length:171 start_codon:yes stop_codon:yes gene_type:complete